MASGRSGPPIKRLLEAIDGEQNGPSAKRLVQATITFSKTASRNGGRVQEETLTAEGDIDTNVLMTKFVECKENRVGVFGRINC